jgi:hypothetical protein
MESQKIEIVEVEGVTLHITVSTGMCSDGIVRSMADPFVQVYDDGMLIALALSSKTVSDQGVRDAISVALTPNQ